MSANNHEQYPCALHDQRIAVIETAVKDLSETTKRLELLAARAVGGFAVLMFAQPLLTGLVLYYLTRSK